MAERPVALRALLHDSPRNLRALSAEHPDGWGVATADEGGWRVERSTSGAASCPRFSDVATRAVASLAIAHVRRKTVGGTSLANTHPFHAGRLVLAHNGTIDAASELSRRSASEHARACSGETDSERLFAFLRTRIDEAGDVAIGLGRAVLELRALPGRAAATFLLSDGERLFAYRQGRSLYALARDRGTRARSVAIASEPLSDEPWLEVPEGALVAVDRAARQVALLELATAA